MLGDEGDATPPALTRCGEWEALYTPRECGAAGLIRYAALHNLQGAAQFCKWRAANPGEWQRLREMAQTGTTAQVRSWMGAAIRDVLQAYAEAGGPTFTIAPNESPNVCRTPLPAPQLDVVSVDETSVTVTIAP
jgi:hypothetical protein